VYLVRFLSHCTLAFCLLLFTPQGHVRSQMIRKCAIAHTPERLGRRCLSTGVYTDWLCGDNHKYMYKRSTTNAEVHREVERVCCNKEMQNALRA